MFEGEWWITNTGEAIRAEGIGGHTGTILHCLHVDNRDVRLSAIKVGWKRVEGLNIESWSLTKEDCSAIKAGLLNIYGENVQYQYLNVFLYSNKREFVQIPFMDLKPTSALRQYGRYS